MSDDQIARCPSCGQWTYWEDITQTITAELNPNICHHVTRKDHT